MFETSDHRPADESPHALNPLGFHSVHYPDIATILEDRALSEDRSFPYTHFDRTLLPDTSRRHSSAGKSTVS